jgi:extracellular factor (EF) 3-hydroxypalmitic acid methyl ester biosynthesis protein
MSEPAKVPDLTESAIPQLILDRVLPLVTPVNHPAGSVVVVPGTRTKSVYYVESGSVEVLHNIQGTRITVAIIGQGNFFGETGFFDGVSRVREIRASEDSLIRTLNYELIQELGQKDPELHSEFITFLARSICTKFRGMVEEREPLAAYAASLSAGRKLSKVSRPLPARFVETKEWLLINQIVESLKADFFDLSHRVQAEPSPEVTEAETEACTAVLDRFNDQLNDFESQIQDPEIGEFAWGFMFKELFPFLMRSRMAERAYYKPKGYAGDYMMMEMLYANEPKGDGKLGLLMDAWFMGITGARAVRSRRELLSAKLAEYIRKRPIR